ncbi:tetratricopeptide repeat-containing sensor histidine kinase [Dinghuibacter silviterrae]|uniref:histidine kinase n=1 Tax=Dinghuibacter silviterrae TaxID=1539049 RepID=A0A4R8DID7_9BACT|nr:ATP-binding protein [Dinghuibacter silviterrae]TDW97503.1 signal transduction histidine kinase [Dinghuibacter silviterrae]
MSRTLGKYIGWYILALSLGVACERNTPEHPAFFDPVFRHADSLEYRGDQWSVAYVDSMFSVFAGTPGPLDQFRRYDFLASHEGYGRHDYAASNRFIDSMLLVSKPFAQDPHYMDRYGQALLEKGNVLISLGQNDEAFAYFLKGKALSDQFPDSCYFSSQFNEQLGLIAYTQHKFADAIVYFLASLDKLSDCRSHDPYSSFQKQQGQLDNIGLCYGELGKYDSALYYFQRTLDYLGRGEAQYREPGQLAFIAEAKALVNGNRSEIYDKMGDYVREGTAIRASILPAGNHFDNGILSLAELNLRHLGRLDTARQQLALARQQLDTMHHEVEDELMWRRLTWQYYDTTHNLSLAYPAYQSYVHLRDSLVKARQDLSQRDVKHEFDKLERQHQLEQLQDKNVLQRDYLLIAIGFATLSVVILLLIWWNWRRSGRNLRIIGLHNKHLELTLESLEQRNRDYDHLFKMVAHDLRNPIAGISGITNLLGESERINEEDRQMLALIQHSCSQLLRLIHELLESKSNPETRRMSMSWCDMSALLEECVALLQVKAEEKRQQIKLSGLSSATLLADRNKMWRVLNNLLTNAIKFSPEKSVIRVSALRQEHNLLITVTDQGIGIPEDMREKIFDAFGGARRSGTQGEQSFGLGLSICRQIVEAHGGSIWFDSEPGQGTTFYVTLPMPMIVEEAEAAV